MPSIAVIRALVESRLPGALSPYIQPYREMLATGVETVDLKTGGVPRSALTQICACPEASSGKTALLLSLMAEVTAREEFCALVDAGDSFDPASAEAAGVDLSRLLWVRCQSKSGVRPLEQAFKATDIIVQNGGFGLIAVDLASVDEKWIRKIPLSTWFRFSRVVEKVPTALLFLMGHPAAQSCAALTLYMSGKEACWHGHEKISQGRVLSQLVCEVEVGRTRMMTRKPVRSASGCFAASPVWS
jgi:recombination protein RecA